MKLLIAYDGSKDSQSAIDDLRCCGLPDKGLAEVISVAEIWLPPANSLGEPEDKPSPYVEEMLRDCRRKGEKAVAEAEILARFAATQVKAALPEWDVKPTATYGSPGWEIVSEGEKYNADLILVGAQGQSLLSRFVLGSISQQVLTEAPCSVRVGRGSIDLDSGPTRMIIGFDGSRGASAAVAAITGRNWNDNSEVRLINVSEPVIPSTIGRFVTPVTSAVHEVRIGDQTLVEISAAAAIRQLEDRGLKASFCARPGNAKHVLPDEAERWGADCIFVGANAWGSRFERFLIGSTSAAVAARAQCSVEVVSTRELVENAPTSHPVDKTVRSA